MKKLLLTLTVAIFAISTILAQAPQAFKYQAIARDASGNTLADQAIGIKVNILQGSQDGPVVFTETHQIQTNSFGLINIGIGKGEIRAGNFSTINWGGNSHYVRVEMDPAGGTNYELMGTSELLSVPYALYADKAGSGGNRSGEWTNDGTDVYVDETTFPGALVGIGVTNPGAKIEVTMQYGFNSIFKRVNNAPASNPLFLLRRARGSLGAESPILDGDNIGQIAFEGSVTGGGYSRAAAIFAIVDGAPGSTIPGCMIFSTRNGSGTMSRKMVIDSDGRVGIGTTLPGGNLEIYTSSGQLDVVLNRASQSSAALLDFQTAGSSEWALYTPPGGDDFYIDRSSGSGDLSLAYSGGNVGVGTNNPSVHFQVYGFVKINPTSQPNRYVQIGSSGGNTFMTLHNNSSVITTRIATSGASYFNGGNLGIGTTAPSEDLHVAGSIKMVDGNEANGKIMKSNATGTGAWVDPSTIAGIWSMNGTKIYYTGGSVGVGTTNPTTTFHVSGPAVIYPAGPTNQRFTFFSDGNSRFDMFSNAAINTVRVHSIGNSWFNGGNVGIGTTSPTGKLHIKENSSNAYQIMIEQDSHIGDAAIRLEADTVPNRNDFTLGIDNDDDNNFEISNTSSLTGSGQTDYTDANTMMRINHARNAGVDGIIDFNHQSRARAFLSDSITLWSNVPMPWLLDWYMRPWFPIPFNKKAPQNRPGFDEHSEFTLSAAPPPAGTPLPWAFFTANEEGYYQVNARVEIIPDSLPEWYQGETWLEPVLDGMTKSYPSGYSGVENDNLRQTLPPPFPVLLSIGIFVNGSLYAQGNNYQLNTLIAFQGDWLHNVYQEFMNAPNVSDVVYLDQDDYVEIYVMVTAVHKTTGPPPVVNYLFPLWINIVGDDNGVFTFVSVHKVS